MTETLLDSSVVLAFLQGEHHEMDEDQVLAGAAIASINLAEVIAVLLRKGVPEEVVTPAIADLGLKVVPFDGEAAAVTGRLIPRARPLGIGLGDCACIATGMVRGATIYTGDREWLELGAEVDIRLIR